VSDGGLAVTIAESCFAIEGLSADVNLTPDAEPAEVALFGERGARAVVSLSAASLARLNAVAAQYGVAANRIGTVTRSEFRIQFNGTPVIRGDVSSFRKAWSESLAAAIENA
jgi:phosphoribosylformylglycinamidine synthase subunit PurL